MRDDCREDDGPHPLGDDVAEQQAERRHHDHQHQQLAELDADVEREQRGEQVRAGELHRVLQAEREAEPVHEAEQERDQPSAMRPLDGDVLQRHVDDRRGDERLDERRKPERVGGEVVS